MHAGRFIPAGLHSNCQAGFLTRRVESRELHRDGDRRDAAESAGISQAWKLMLWGSRGLETKVAGLHEDGTKLCGIPAGT